MFQIISALLWRFGPSESELEQARAELINRATKGSLSYDAKDDYPALFASLRKEQAIPYIDAVNSADPNYNQLVASVLKVQLAGLRSRFSTIALSPTSRTEALDLIWEAYQSDAACAMEQLQVFGTVKSVLQASIIAFISLLALQSAFAAVRDCLRLVGSNLSPGGSLPAGLGLAIMQNVNNFFFSPYILTPLIAVIGALFGIYMDLPLEGTTPHWRLVHKYSRITRCWAGAAAGLLTVAMAPILGAPIGADQVMGGKILVAAFLFGFLKNCFSRSFRIWQDWMVNHEDPEKELRLC